ncbi:MAG: VanW family protein [Anaerolineae bacterium]|nr:VanW family protein [Anaerolineae bacterium]
MSYSTYPPRNPNPEPEFNPWLVRIPLLIITGGVLLVGTLAALIIAFQMRYSNLVMPGVASSGVALGGMTREEARAALLDSFRYDDQVIFTFRYGDQFWQYSAGDLGIGFDVEATLDQAFGAGRSESVVSNLAQQASIWLNGRGIAPVIRYDQNTTLAAVQAMATEINRPAANATLQIEGTSVITTPGQSGRALDVQTTLMQIDEAIRSLRPGGELLLTVNEAAPTVWEAETAAAKVRAALSGPVTLVADNPAGGQPLGPWTATPEQIRAVLSLRLVDNGDGTQSYDVDVNTEAFRGYIANLAPGLISFPRDARFHFDDQTGVIRPIQAAVSGRALDVDATLARLKDGIFSPTNRIVPLQFSYTPARFNDNVTAAELGITRMIAEATTYFAGSTRNRKENVIEAASRFDGIIIAPGEEFSFNTWLGDISPETGFTQGKVIFGGRTIDGVGGGVCQVSTTIFRAALLAGFPITERYSHGYRVGFYEQQNFPPGLDAAIWQPTADFRFINDTGFHLLIETTVFPQNDSIQFRLYSGDTGRQVVMEGPVIRDVTPSLNATFVSNPELAPGQELYVDWAKEGADVTFTRRILDASGQLIREEAIYTHYQPWGAVVQVAPSDPRLTTG